LLVDVGKLNRRSLRPAAAAVAGWCRAGHGSDGPVDLKGFRFGWFSFALLGALSLMRPHAPWLKLLPGSCGFAAAWIRVELEQVCSATWLLPRADLRDGELESLLRASMANTDPGSGR